MTSNEREWDEILQYIQRLETAYQKEKSDHEFTNLTLEDSQKSLEDCVELVRKLREELKLSQEQSTQMIKSLEDEVTHIRAENTRLNEMFDILSQENKKMKAVFDPPKLISLKEEPKIEKFNLPQLNVGIDNFNSSPLKLLYYDMIQLISQFEDNKISDVDFLSNIKSLARTFNQQYEENYVTLSYRLQVLQNFEENSAKQLSYEKTQIQTLLTSLEQMQQQNELLLSIVQRLNL